MKLTTNYTVDDKTCAGIYEWGQKYMERQKGDVWRCWLRNRTEDYMMSNGTLPYLPYCT